MTDLDIASITSKATDALEASMISDFKIYNASRKYCRDIKMFTELMKQLCEVADNNIKRIVTNKPPSFPLKDFLWVYFFQVCLLHEQQQDASLDFTEALGAQVILKVVQSMRDHRKKYNTYIGQDVRSQGPLFSIFDSAVEKAKSKSKPTGHAPNSMNIDNELELSELYIKYGKAFMSLRDILMISIRNWMVDHAVGQSLSTAEVGTPIKLCLGYARP